MYITKQQMCNFAFWEIIANADIEYIIQTLDYCTALGVVYILRKHFPEIIDGILRPKAARVDCGQKPQHHLNHRTLYSRLEDAIIACVRRPQGS